MTQEIHHFGTIDVRICEHKLASYQYLKLKKMSKIRPETFLKVWPNPARKAGPTYKSTRLYDLGSTIRPHRCLDCCLTTINCLANSNKQQITGKVKESIET